MKKALTYIFSDKKLYTQINVLLLLMLLIQSLYLILLNINSDIINLKFLQAVLLSIITTAGCTLLEGYQIYILKFINTNSQEIVLPLFNTKKIFILGIKYVIALTIFSIPLFCIFFGFTNALGIAYAFMQNWVIYLTGSLALLSTIIYLILGIYYVPAATLLFCKTNNIWCFYRFSDAFKIIKHSPKKYIKYATICFVFTLIIDIILGLISFLSKETQLLAWVCIIPMCLLIIYLKLTMTYFLAKIKDTTNYSL